ncbi:hypothetical protein [Ligilactobacillus murinus]|uniref:hypothetical protein n=1 Tax=Ligilactobacillus murinus TaxID=1622 RepID=UPI000E675D0F|nr:hypothetical protein [Ligilactobacillus murinus]NBH40225.1 hypothetical protein [Ligilactobacillus murinus]RII81434.1 hypothetical protein D1870_01130 [Ligilactobacillus murinus]
MKNGDKRIIYWDAKKTGSKLGEPFRYGPTYGEWRKQQGTNLAEWQQPKISIKRFRSVFEAVC